MGASVINQSDAGRVRGGIVAVTASDVTVYDPPLEALNVAGAGAVTVVFADGSTGAIYLAAGYIHAVGSVTKVMSAGTAATGIIGFRG